LPPYPAISRDVNLVVDERVRWSDVATTVRRRGGKFLESLAYVETYRSPQLGAGKKSLLLTMSFRSEQGTMTSEEVDGLRDQIVAACGEKLGAVLRA
jgi:phenylalanyl-tRNA synthetase beta chain